MAKAKGNAYTACSVTQDADGHFTVRHAATGYIERFIVSEAWAHDRAVEIASDYAVDPSSVPTVESHGCVIRKARNGYTVTDRATGRSSTRIACMAYAKTEAYRLTAYRRRPIQAPLSQGWAA